MAFSQPPPTSQITTWTCNNHHYTASSSDRLPGNWAVLGPLLTNFCLLLLALAASLLFMLLLAGTAVICTACMLPVADGLCRCAAVVRVGAPLGGKSGSVVGSSDRTDPDSLRVRSASAAATINALMRKVHLCKTVHACVMCCCIQRVPAFMQTEW